MCPLHIRFGEFLLAISDVDHVKFMTQNRIQLLNFRFLVHLSALNLHILYSQIRFHQSGDLDRNARCFFFATKPTVLNQRCKIEHYLPSRSLTWPLKSYLPNRKVVFQPLFFRGELLNFVGVSNLAILTSQHLTVTPWDPPAEARPRGMTNWEFRDGEWWVALNNNPGGFCHFLGWNIRPILKEKIRKLP